MIRIKYVDNSGNIQEYISSESSFWAALKDMEHNANEIGHGLKAVMIAVREASHE